MAISFWNETLLPAFALHCHLFNPRWKQSNIFSLLSADDSHYMVCLECFPAVGETARYSLCCAAVGVSWD